ncbi:uncharacterized protein CLAFUR5_20289 [Fulvia fulva]|uniref:uncharacterized protein n=1 Tax=Passalora fulva TaxID=5499 RepID=UPI002852C76B|nr:uncharacterized protein CLAFUR5_20289 [Fulvia fulva]KAK4617196.1 hypothetical protein CLAFUR0_09944 [Fulvia fulva]WMI39031.1 hypothetical protein CLAFUR5_20289 [Fulvia fulva]
MSPPPGAAARVFALPELLDMILLEVSDCLQIFVLRRTNSTFNDTVSGCKSLRRRIFLEHSPGRTYNDVNEFLGQAPLKHATAPFDFLTLDTGFHCILCEELNPEHSFSVRDQLFPRCRLKSSWRDILVGLPESSSLSSWAGRTVRLHSGLP